MRINRIPLIILTTLLVVAFGSCYYDKRELVYPVDTSACDTTAVKYTGDVVNILSANCYSCHDASHYALSGGGNQLDSYAAASVMASRILVQVESGLMPQGGAKLSSCNIARIRSWIRDGVPEN